MYSFSSVKAFCPRNWEGRFHSKTYRGNMTQWKKESFRENMSSTPAVDHYREESYNKGGRSGWKRKRQSKGPWGTTGGDQKWMEICRAEGGYEIRAAGWRWGAEWLGGGAGWSRKTWGWSSRVEVDVQGGGREWSESVEGGVQGSRRIWDHGGGTERDRREIRTAPGQTSELGSWPPHAHTYFLHVHEEETVHFTAKDYPLLPNSLSLVPKAANKQAGLSWESRELPLVSRLIWAVRISSIWHCQAKKTHGGMPGLLPPHPSPLTKVKLGRIGAK